MIGEIRDNGQLDWSHFFVVEEGNESLLLSHVAGWIRHAAQRIWHSLRPLSSGSQILGMAVDVSRSRRDMIIENAVLRHQINIVRRGKKRPRLGATDRLKLLLGASLLPAWRQAIAIVQPDTLLRWHRAGFRLFWRLQSGPRPNRGARPKRAHGGSWRDLRFQRTHNRWLQLQGQDSRMSWLSDYCQTLGARSYGFADLATLMARASPRKSGDELAGVAARNDEERVAARMCLAEVPLMRFLEEPLVPYEQDEITRLILDGHDVVAFAAISDLTVGGLRDWLLGYETDSAALAKVAPGLTPEMAAAVTKLMRNQDLILVASKCRVVSRFRNTLGLPGRLAIRLQPNHPCDDLRGIAASILDGLLYGAGDAVIGINPASNSLQNVVDLLAMIDGLRQRFDIPTQSCVLTHVTSSLAAIDRGAPVDLVFQSIGGTEATNRSFGVDIELLREARAAALSLKRGTLGDNVMYFETGQGSSLSAGAHHGLDQQTCEARAYGLARHFQPLLVNTVVGFIGPEYLYDGKQITRAGLEDHFCGKLLGLPMGCDVCYTNHAEADQDDMDNLVTLLAVAGCNYFMGVPGADDVMLNYQSTSFHDALYVRSVLGLLPAPEFADWLARMRILDGVRLQGVDSRHALLGAIGKSRL